jgi:hypothetical protein
MGVQAADTVTLIFLNTDGKTERRPRFTGQAIFYSARRPVEPNTQDPVFGSLDWLTDVMVGDTQESLGSLEPSQTLEAYTSSSSRGVLVQWAMGAEEHSEKNCITVAIDSGGAPFPTSTQEPYIVDTVYVMPWETKMVPDGNDMWNLWKQQAIALNTVLAEE